MSAGDAKTVAAPKPEKTFTITNPVVLMYPCGESLVCDLCPPASWNHHHYGIVVCDLVRHIANAFHVSEDDVWEWVDKEREHHTSPVLPMV